jgi:hypothetical protein
MATKGKKVIKGGARKGAGRKPVEDPKVMVPLYVESSVIKAWGGFDEVRNACYSLLKSKPS